MFSTLTSFFYEGDMFLPPPFIGAMTLGFLQNLLLFFPMQILHFFTLFITLSSFPPYPAPPPLPLIIYLIIYLFDERSCNLSIDRSIYTFLAEIWVTNFILFYACMCVCVVSPSIATITIYSSSWWRGLICKLGAEVTGQADPRLEESRAVWARDGGSYRGLGAIFSGLFCCICSAGFSIRMSVMYVCIYVQ